MSGYWCDTCEGASSEFCSGPCDECGESVHCNHEGRCRDCQDNRDEAAWEAQQSREWGPTLQERQAAARRLK